MHQQAAMNTHQAGEVVVATNLVNLSCQGQRTLRHLKLQRRLALTMGVGGSGCGAGQANLVWGEMPPTGYHITANRSHIRMSTESCKTKPKHTHTHTPAGAQQSCAPETRSSPHSAKSDSKLRL